MPAAATPSEIARFLIEEHKPSLGKNLRAMSDEEVGTSIIDAVSERFPDWRPDDLAHALLLAQEVETADVAFASTGRPS